MTQKLVLAVSIVLGLIGQAAVAQVKDFKAVTREMLLNPSPNDWLMFSRTYDEQRFSPLNQINRQNVSQLRLAWARGMEPGSTENIPIVYDGVMYVASAPAGIQALDATTGDLIWEYQRTLPKDLSTYVGGGGRARSIAIYQDLIFYAAPDGYLEALDARTGKVRWETEAHDYKTHDMHTTGPVVVEGKVLTGRSCPQARCFVIAHDALTGKELWKFYTTPAPGEPGGDSWGSVPTEARIASPWGLPGSYDPVRNLVYWGVANPEPITRLKRHHGNVDEVPRSAPSDLYSESTVALNPETGKLIWYYQHLPGDDWDLDHAHERILIRTALNPDPKEIKWINPKIRAGEQRDITVSVAEAGGIWVNDRTTGEFLWATPFPFDTPLFNLSRIDVDTGKTYINWDLVLKDEGDRHTVCYNNTKSYWPMAYYPEKNSLYIPYTDSCADISADSQKNRMGYGVRLNVARPGGDPKGLAGIAKVNVATGKLERFFTTPIPGSGAVLATAGNLIFWGDMNRRFRAFDADSGKILWEQVVGSIVQMSTITYTVNGKQYVAVMTGEGAAGTYTVVPLVPGLKPPRNHNTIYVFALPDAN